MTTRRSGGRDPRGVRERIDAAAYELFCRFGARAVGVDAIVERSGVAKQTLYRHYRSKDALVLAFLQRRWDLFGTAWAAQVQRGGNTAEQRLLAVFDALETWFRQPDFYGCPVIKLLFEQEDAASEVNKRVLEYFAGLQAFLERLAREAKLREPAELARQWMLLIKGAIVSAYSGERKAAPRARQVAKTLLASWGRAARRRSK